MTPTPPLRDAHTTATRRRIVEAVAAIVLHEHPTAFSVPAVAARAGVSVRTVYRYFPTKENLLDALAEYGGDTGVQLLEAEHVTMDDWLDQLPDLFANLDKNRDVVQAQFHSAGGREARIRRIEARRAKMRAAVAEEAPELAEADADRLTTLCMLLGSSVALYELTDYHGLDAHEAAALGDWATRALVREALRAGAVARELDLTTGDHPPGAGADTDPPPAPRPTTRTDRRRAPLT